jgi:hypothetical protein
MDLGYELYVGHRSPAVRQAQEQKGGWTPIEERGHVTVPERTFLGCSSSPVDDSPDGTLLSSVGSVSWGRSQKVERRLGYRLPRGLGGDELAYGCPVRTVASCCSDNN